MRELARGGLSDRIGYSKKATLKEVSLRRIWTLFRSYSRMLYFILFLALTAAVMGLVPPLIMQRIIDEAIPNKNMTELFWYALLMVSIPVISGMLGVWQNHLNTKVAQGVMRDLRQGLFRNLQQQSMSFFTGARSGEVVQRVTDDVQAVQNVVTSVVVSSITQIVIVFTTIGILFWMDWRLAILSVIVLPLFMIPVRKVSAMRKQLRNETQKVRGDMSSMLGEIFGISGAMLTRIFGREKSQEQSFEQMNTKVMDMELKLNLMGRWFMMFLGVLGPLGTAIIYIYGGYAVIHDMMSIGAIVAFTAYLTRLYQPFGTLLNLHVEVATSLGVFKRIFEYLDMSPEVTEKPHAAVMQSTRGDVTYEHVSFAYQQDADVLQDISFAAKAGEMVALVGPSGAGKSTLISMIGRLYDPTEGTITIDGQKITDVTLESLREQMAYVTQESFLFHATLRDNLRFAKEDATDAEMEEACRKAYIYDFVQGLSSGLNTMVGERGHRLSGGERQRIAIARAILKNPRILILDEATSHLDSESESYVQAALQDLMKDRTTLVIAHRLSTVLAADQILVVEDGRIVERGTHEQLLEQDGLYTRLYNKQGGKTWEEPHGLWEVQE
ncbi:ABC transporter ATP-binding protein/permease [Paenibacillus sp. N1-5-1-14]|uniref:ABC transporter ATP-binding protein n=1 Tax=Paenibacillus radicibacter TaxID=2972488 RepID=UPI0021599E8E|nr:ABC transporter ATP-binding protein [Paenibacillus radicibacter]MCR8644724.1 ABC transporter ATP-binding protein/permease [Paenibacillus radicibacter]